MVVIMEKSRSLLPCIVKITFYLKMKSLKSKTNKPCPNQNPKGKHL